MNEPTTQASSDDGEQSPAPDADEAQFVVAHRTFMYIITLAAVLFSAGAIVLVMNISTVGVRGFLCVHEDQWPDYVTWIGLALLAVGALLAASAPFIGNRQRSRRAVIDDFNPALTGLGFALVLLATLNFIALAGFASQGVLEAVLSKDATIDMSIICNHPATDGQAGTEAAPLTDAEAAELRTKLTTLFLLLLPGFAVLGSLFFVAGSLQRKRDAFEQAEAAKKAQEADKPAGDQRAPGSDESTEESARFSADKLWAGLWYRLGEAVLFALVIFLLQRARIIKVDALPETWLLVIGLLMGMFVKPAERLINGIAVRLFKGIEAMVK